MADGYTIVKMGDALEAMAEAIAKRRNVSMTEAYAYLASMCLARAADS